MFGEAVANTVLELAYSDSKIYAITPAMVIGSGLYNFSKELPNQLIDVGIAEENAVVMAAGMAQAGLKPAVFIYSTLQRAYDQISHDVARTNSHVVFYIDRAGLVDDDGERIKEYMILPSKINPRNCYNYAKRLCGNASNG